MGRLVNVIRPSVFSNCGLLKLYSCPSTESRRLGALLFLMVTFQRDSFQVLEKGIQRLYKIYITKE